jgi:RimJ/RimL family protein N-acetyltransferase
MLFGEKICLGPVLNADVAQLFTGFDTLEIANASGPYRPSAEAKFNQWLAGAANDPSRVLFVIRKLGDLRLLGHVHVSNIQSMFRSADIGLGIGLVSDRGQGYGGEALTLAVRYCWNELNLQRVALTVLGDNPAALRLYERLGFEVEGRLRRATYVGGQFHDVMVMSILRPEPC